MIKKVESGFKILYSQTRTDKKSDYKYLTSENFQKWDFFSILYLILMWVKSVGFWRTHKKFQDIGTWNFILRATFLSNVCRHDKATKRKIFTTNDNSRVFKTENILVRRTATPKLTIFKIERGINRCVMKILNVDSLITKHLITSLYNKPIYVISEFSKKKVWSKQDSVRRQHHIKRFFASWPCRTLVCTTEIHKIIGFKGSWPTSQCLKIK